MSNKKTAKEFIDSKEFRNSIYAVDLCWNIVGCVSEDEKLHELASEAIDKLTEVFAECDILRENGEQNEN